MLTSRTIKTELAGKEFSMSNAADGSKVKFKFPTTFQGWPRQGGEAFVAPIVCKHPHKGDTPSIIKLFFSVAPDRAKRQSHLVKFGLANKHDWLYEGVPYAWVDTTVAGHRIYGHVAKHVCYNRKGDDFRIVRDTVAIDDFTEDNRRALAGQLCNAIVGLEKIKIVHGDLSPANIIIGKQSDDDVHCVLIDYDGFHSPNVPKLPRQHDGKQLRGLGTPGYQHPSLARKTKSDTGTDDTLFVVNDRFALGVLCFELMVWTTQISNHLVGRTQLIDEDELANGRLIIPDAVKPIWPEGLKLLEESISEPDVNSLPSPEDWLRALGFLGADWRSLRKDWATTAFLKFYRRRGNQAPVKHQLVHFEGHLSQGDFEKVDARLADVVYSYKNENGRCVAFSLQIKSSNPVLIKRGGITKNLGAKPDEIEIGPGDYVLTDDWILEFQDASLGTNW